MASSTQIPIKILLLRSRLPDVIGSYPISIPCNTLPSSLWAQPSTQQPTGDFSHSIPQNREATVSDTETDQATPPVYRSGDEKDKGPGQNPAPSQPRACPMGSTRLAVAPPTVGAVTVANEDLSPRSAGPSDSAIFSISFSRLYTLLSIQVLHHMTFDRTLEWC